MLLVDVGDHLPHDQLGHVRLDRADIAAFDPEHSSHKVGDTSLC